MSSQANTPSCSTCRYGDNGPNPEGCSSECWEPELIDYDPIETSAAPEKTVSDYIDHLVRCLRSFDVKVHLYAFDLPCAGMYRSETKEIFLNEPNALQGLITLAHEAGHWLGYEVLKKPKPHSYQRERQAFVYGWRILQWLGATKLVSREAWIKAERERRAAPDVDTSGVSSREELP